MKKFLTLAAIVAASLTLNSCGMGNNSANTMTPGLAGGALPGTVGNNGSLLTSALTSTGTNVVGTVLGTLLGGSTASAKSLVGTWVYSDPKVVFESTSILAQLGSSVASSKIETTLKNQLTKMGFKAGKSTLTLNEDKTCVFALNGRTLNGTYAYDTNTNTLTITGALGVSSVSCTCTMNAGQLYMLYEADKLLAMATNLSAMTTTTTTLSTLLSSYSGLKVGWSMSRK